MVDQTHLLVYLERSIFDVNGIKLINVISHPPLQSTTTTVLATSNRFRKSSIKLSREISTRLGHTMVPRGKEKDLEDKSEQQGKKLRGNVQRAAFLVRLVTCSRLLLRGVVPWTWKIRVLKSRHTEPEAIPWILIPLDLPIPSLSPSESAAFKKNFCKCRKKSTLLGYHVRKV